MAVDVSNSFMEELNSILEIKTDYESKTYNYEWIEKFEEVIPYIDNIIRNPKRFIINEEEIVKVELAKKVTVESVIHLTQHTNLIQDYDKKKGEVKPSKILNINKDDSLDTYENRVIYTLIDNMLLFYGQHSAKILGDSYYIDSKEAKYEANTKIGTENVKVSLYYSSLDNNVTSNSGANIEARLKKIKMQLDIFTSSELFQTLKHLHTSPVRSPIKKTNVILKNPNFQKAVELWNYLQTYQGSDCAVTKKKKDIHDIGLVKGQFDQAFLLDYLGMVTLSQKKDEVSQRKAISLALARVIENILDLHDEVLEDKMRKVFKDEFKNAKNKVDKRNQKIINIFNDKLESANKAMEEACSLLD